MIQKFFTHNRYLILALLVLAMAAVIYLTFGRNNAKTVIPSTSPPQSQNSAPRGNSQSVPSNASSTAAAQGTNQKSSVGSTSSGSHLSLSEAQTFVSNHSPGQNSQEQSVCNTTQGATCYIEFTKGNVTKQLQAEVAGSDGSIIWNWDIEEAGLSSGSWTVKAVAQLNGETTSIQDPRALVIQ